MNSRVSMFHRCDPELGFGISREYKIIIVLYHQRSKNTKPNMILINSKRRRDRRSFQRLFSQTSVLTPIPITVPRHSLISSYIHHWNRDLISHRKSDDRGEGLYPHSLRGSYPLEPSDIIWCLTSLQEETTMGLWCKSVVKSTNGKGFGLVK